VKKLRTGILVAAITLGSVLGVAGPALATTVNVGGGTWTYGTSYVFPILKDVYSKYINNMYYHSATAIGGTATQKVYAVAHNWANAGIRCGASETGYTYWANY
jgi:lactococcin 972 family bacteriocin